MTSVDRVYGALREVVDPCSAATGSNLDIVEMGLVKDIAVSGGEVRVDLRLTTPACHQVAYFIVETERHVGDLPGVESVRVEADDGLEWTEEMMSDGARRRRERVFRRHRARYAGGKDAE